MVKEIISVLKFEAFRPEPDDGSATWASRFPKKRTLLVNSSRRRTNWRYLEKNGTLGDGAPLEGELREACQQQGAEWKEMTEAGWCALSLNTRFVVSLEANLSRRKGMEDLIRTNPKAALGAKAERGKRYHVTHNPESNTSVLLSCDEEAVTRSENVLKEAGLHTGRICIGVYAMLVELIAQVEEARKAMLKANPDTSTGSILMVACCEGSLCALLQQNEQWIKLRSRSELYTDDFGPAVDLILPMIEEAGRDTHVLFMNEVENPEFGQMLATRLPGVRFSDVTVTDQLWKILADI